MTGVMVGRCGGASNSSFLSVFLSWESRQRNANEVKRSYLLKRLCVLLYSFPNVSSLSFHPSQTFRFSLVTLQTFQCSPQTFPLSFLSLSLPKLCTSSPLSSSPSNVSGFPSFPPPKVSMPPFSLWLQSFLLKQFNALVRRFSASFPSNFLPLPPPSQRPLLFPLRRFSSPFSPFSDNSALSISSSCLPFPHSQGWLAEYPVPFTVMLHSLPVFGSPARHCLPGEYISEASFVGFSPSPRSSAQPDSMYSLSSGN